MPLRQKLRRHLREFFPRRDDASTQDQVTKHDDRHGQSSTSTLPVSTFNSPTSLPERLWDRAYDDLKIHDAALVQTYESILSRKLGGQGFDAPVTESEQNIIAQDDTHARRNQMRQLIHEGLNKTATEAKVKGAIGTATEFIFSAKDIISSAVQAVPQAALAWTGVCVALEIIQNPIAATEANRNGIEYVIKRMDWYWKLSSVVLKDNVNDSSLSDVRRELETQVIDLYKVLLSYEIKSICSYYRNRGLVLLRDIVSLDDWKGDVQAIQNAERVFHDDSNTYAGLKMVSNLEQLVTHAEMQSTAQITKEDQQCIKDLRLTDPGEDKKRIEQTKGGLLQESYSWVLHNPDYQKWRDSEESRLLWIKGDPGKGKTMLLCGIINELNQQSNRLGHVSYFFCQATDQRINNAAAALRGLIFMLVNQQPSLISHLRKKCDQAGAKLFEGPNTWIALSDIFTAILQDPALKSTFLVVDALDECVSDLEKLLDLIVHSSGIDARVKWIVSSRNWSRIEKRLRRTEQKVKLSLELNAESVSSAVDNYIHKKVHQLSDLNDYDKETSKKVQEYLSKNANDTFLWVALVCRNLENYARWDVLQMLNAFLPGLDSLYKRMMDQVLTMGNDGHVNLCRQILAVVVSVYRPVTLRELGCLIEIREELSADVDYLKEIVALCGSFLTIRRDTIYFVHQSAKDFLSKNENVIFPSGHRDVHHTILSLSLQAMNKTLRKNICALSDTDTLTGDDIGMPDTESLSAVRYSCIYWVDHLRDRYAKETGDIYQTDLNDDGDVYLFLRKHLLHWLEALSLLQDMPAGIISITVLEGLLSEHSPNGQLRMFIQDAHRFVLYNKRAIEIAPTQIYSSALVFSPMQSLVRKAFYQEIPSWIQNRPVVEDNWSPCLQTLEGHADSVISVAYLADRNQIASGSADETIKIWDIATGACTQTLEGHTGSVNSVAFLAESRRIISGSGDKTIKIWDIEAGVCVQTLQGHSDKITSVTLSANGQVISGSEDKTIKIWDIETGVCVLTLKGHSDEITSVAFSAKCQVVISGSMDGTIKIWDPTTGVCVQTLEGHEHYILSIALSANGQVISGSFETFKIWDIETGVCVQTLKKPVFYTRSMALSANGRIISGSDDKAIKIWDIETGMCVQTLEGHKGDISSIALSANGYIISGSGDDTIKIWDIAAGIYNQTLEGHDSPVSSIAFLEDGQTTSGSADNTTKIWDIATSANVQNFNSHFDCITLVAFSLDGRQVASGSDDNTLKIWDVYTGVCIQTLEGHISAIRSLAFSKDGQVGSGSYDDTAKIWDVDTGLCIQILKDHTGTVGSIAFSADGQYIASGSDDTTVKIWDVDTGLCIQTLEGCGRYVTSVTFSMDSQQLASGSIDRAIKIWDVATGNCTHTLGGHSREILAVAFSADGQYIASGSWDGIVKIWDAVAGACIQTLDVGTVNHLSFDPTTNSRIYSNLGTLDLDLGSAPVANELGNKSLLQRVTLRGYGMQRHGEWILKDGKQLLWVPAEYRPSGLAVVGSTIAVGCNSGRFFIMKFSETG